MTTTLRFAAIPAELLALEPELIAIRLDLHRCPETGFEEVRTAALVAERLRTWGLEVVEGIAKTGVVGALKGRLAGNGVIALRADMDALDVQEIAGRLRGSTIPGKMHPCGHDGHPAMLLGAARHLAVIRILPARSISCFSRPRRDSRAAA